MREQARRIAGKVPAEVMPAVARIHEAVRDLVRRDDGLVPGTLRRRSSSPRAADPTTVRAAVMEPTPLSSSAGQDRA